MGSSIFELDRTRRSPVPDFRYAQFCPLARASELLGERWTLPILRELFVGPQRFTDLRRRLPGLSSSVLATRLDRLARAEIVVQRELPPPAASLVYELSESGRALQPVIREMIRWGSRFLGAPKRGDHFEPDWPIVVMESFARSRPTPARPDPIPARRIALRLAGADAPPVEVWVSGGKDGTRVSRTPPAGAVDLRVSAPPLVLLGLVAGRLAPAAVRATANVTLEGDADALVDLPRLFELADPPEPSPARPPQR
jgi:DNA-binding HxlR family transcriptional regulator